MRRQPLGLLALRRLGPDHAPGAFAGPGGAVRAAAAAPEAAEDGRESLAALGARELGLDRAGIKDLAGEGRPGRPRGAAGA